MLDSLRRLTPTPKGTTNHPTINEVFREAQGAFVVRDHVLLGEKGIRPSNVSRGIR